MKSPAIVNGPSGLQLEAEEQARPPLAEEAPWEAEQAGCYARGLRILMIVMAVLVILSMLLQMSQWFGLRWRPERIVPPDWWRMEERALESGPLGGGHRSTDGGPIRAATLDRDWRRRGDMSVVTTASLTAAGRQAINSLLGERSRPGREHSLRLSVPSTARFLAPTASRQ